MIQLRNEGAIKPAPVLQGVAQTVSTQIQSWPRVIAVTHWQLGDPSVVEGAEFHVKEGGELGHIHQNGELHLLLTEELRNQLIGLELARPLIWDKRWVVWAIKSPNDVEHALWLCGLGYQRLVEQNADEVASSIQSRITQRRQTSH